MSPTNTAQTGLFKEKGASHRREAPSCLHFVPSARDDQALAGHDHPAAVLLANGVDTAETGYGIAGIDLVHAATALDQGAAVGDVPQYPALHGRQPGHFGLGRRRGCRGGGVTAATCCGIEPVMSFAEAGAAAAVVVDAWAARSLSTVSLSLASFAAGSACAFSTLSRRSLALLNWPVVVLELCSRLAFSATISASSRATEVSSAVSFAEAWVDPGPALRRSAFQCPRSPARHPAHPPPSPAPPRQPSPRTGACRTIPLRRSLGTDAVAGRHDHHIAGEARRFRLHGVDLGSVDLGSIIWALRPSRPRPLALPC